MPDNYNNKLSAAQDVMNMFAQIYGVAPPDTIPNQIGEVTVYSKGKYLDALKQQQQKYLADMATYRQDSTQWVQANKAYQDSLNLYNNVYDLAANENKIYASSNRKRTAEELIDYYIKGDGGVKDWEESKARAIKKGGTNISWYDEQIKKASAEKARYSKKGVIDEEARKAESGNVYNFNRGAGYQLKHNKNDLSTSTDGYFHTPLRRPNETSVSEYKQYLDGFINYRKQAIAEAKAQNKNTVSVSGMASTNMEGAKAELNNAIKLKATLGNKIKPVGYTGWSEGLEYPIYKKPVAEPVQPEKPKQENKVKYDPKYESMKMRSLWANKAKADPNAKIGVFGGSNYNDERKGFTIEEALQFPKEIRDKYNIDLIYNQIKKKK